MKVVLFFALVTAAVVIADDRDIEMMAVDPSGVVMIAYTPTFAAGEGDIYEYAALVAPADERDMPLMLDMHQASCCKDADGKCHDWHQALSPKRVTCHGLNVSVDYKASVVIRLANSTSVPIVIASKRVVAVSKDVVSLTEGEYVDLINQVVESTANEEATSGTKQFQLHPIPIAIILGSIAAFLLTLVMLIIVIRKRKRRAAKRQSLLPHYEPMLQDYDLFNCR